jgi:hypothetical protein
VGEHTVQTGLDDMIWHTVQAGHHDHLLFITEVKRSEALPWVVEPPCSELELRHRPRHKLCDPTELSGVVIIFPLERDVKVTLDPEGRLCCWVVHRSVPTFVSVRMRRGRTEWNSERETERVGCTPFRTTDQYHGYICSSEDAPW